VIEILAAASFVAVVAVVGVVMAVRMRHRRVEFQSRTNRRPPLRTRRPPKSGGGGAGGSGNSSIDARELDRFGFRHVEGDAHPTPTLEQPKQPRELTLEQLIAHEIVTLHRAEHLAHEQEEREQRDEHHRIDEERDRAEASMLVAEARDLIVDLNDEFGWAPGEPSIADRLFNTNVAAMLGATLSAGKVDFRTRAIITRMRSFARAANGGRSELAKVMAVRTLLGTGRLTEEEAAKLSAARRLFGDDFAEAGRYVDRITRAQEVVIARRLGIPPSQVRPQDLFGDRSPVTATDGNHGHDRSIGDDHNSLR
jgi:hypothetical protein